MLNDQRKSEISGRLLKIFLKKAVLRGGVENFDRELGNVAKQIKIPLEELREFLRPLCEAVFEEILKEHFWPKTAQG